MQKAVFLDRDGVINIDYGYIGQIERFDIIKGTALALKKFKDMGYLTVLVTNQSGIARGKYTYSDFLKVTSFMQANLSLYDACFDWIYCCPHHENAYVEQYRVSCECRKPKPGMFYSAERDLKIDLHHSVMIGDHATDLFAARRAGISSLFLIGEHLKEESPLCPEAVCYKTIGEVVEFIRKNQ